MSSATQFSKLVFLAGAGLMTLSACSSDAGTQELGGGDNWGNPPGLKINCDKGNSDNHGRNPRCSEGDFNPEYYNVVYLKFRENSSDAFLTARHAYFPASGDTDDVSCALEYLRTDGQSNDNCNVFTDNGNIAPIRYDFKDLHYGSEQRVYVVIDNDDVGFNTVRPMLFTKWGAFDDQYATGTGKPKPKNRNKSFGAEELRIVDGRNTLYFENYYRDKNGNPMGKKPPKDKHTNYSINFNLVVCKQAGCDLEDKDQVIPVVVDPDTNNGLGIP